jgi:hypothetical protein
MVLVGPEVAVTDHGRGNQHRVRPNEGVASMTGRPHHLPHPGGFVASVAAMALVGSACAETRPDPMADASELQVVTVALLDGGGGADDRGFGRVSDVEIDVHGNVYVLDELDRTVRAFDRQGTLLRTFGQRGQGPGELERPSALSWGPDGNLWVVDPGTGRFTVFDQDGDLVATYPDPEPFFLPMAVGFSEAGLLYRAGMLFEGGSLEDPRFLLIESEVGNRELRELRRFELPFIERPDVFELRGDGMRLIQEIPFSSEPVFHVDSRGQLWYAQTREPWVHRWSQSGGEAQRMGREFEPTRVTAAERRELLQLEEFEELRIAAGPSRFAEFTSLIPETMPHLKGFFFDDRENLWIMRAGSDGCSDGTVAMDVYDSRGTLIGTARTRMEPQPRPRVRRGLMVGVTTDRMGVESIVISRIEP